MEQEPATATSPLMQQLLMRLASTLSRRRSYAATHPMVLSAEEQLFETLATVLREQPVLTIGNARTDLLIDGQPYAARGSFGRELATRLHRRGVGAISFNASLPLDQLRAALGWLATERESDLAKAETPPVLSGVIITPLAWDQLTLGESARVADASADQLWRALAQIAGNLEFRPVTTPGARSTGFRFPGTPRPAAAEGGGDPAFRVRMASPDVAGSATATTSIVAPAGMIGFGDSASPASGATTGLVADTEERTEIVERLQAAMLSPGVALQTAMAVMDTVSQAALATQEIKHRIGEQLNAALVTLGESSFGPIIKSLGDRALQQRFVSQMVDVLPVAAVADWLRVAAQTQEQQISHQMLRLMSKLSSYATERESLSAELVFRGAAQELVKAWELADPNPEEHVALLDRIALHERALVMAPVIDAAESAYRREIESARLVQMALEIDVLGADGEAAAEALVDAGAGAELRRWARSSGQTDTARQIRSIATSSRAVRKLLLTEPVDRLQARALLDDLDATSAETLLDVLELAEARGTRMIVRQRLAEFGSVILPALMARLDTAPWYLVRNILTLLQDLVAQEGSGTAAQDSLTRLLDHAQVQVRTETLRLLLLDPTARDMALRHALHDASEQVVMLVLQTLSDTNKGNPHLSDALVLEIIALVNDGRHNDTVRARAVRVVGSVVDPVVRDWLVSLAVRRSTILRRRLLAQPTHTAVAAVAALQTTWSRDGVVQTVLDLVRKKGRDTRWNVRDVPPGTERTA